MKRLRRSGWSLIELLAAATVALLSAYVCVGALRFTRTTFTSVTSEQKAKQLLGIVDARMGPVLRNALRVDVGKSTPASLTVYTPATDASGAVVAPMTDGKSYAFYLSDVSGDPSKPGSILWRSVNGIKDSDWSLLDGKYGRVDLGTSGQLSFTFDSTTDPENVTVSVQTTQTVSGKPIATAASNTYFLRNHFITRQ